MAEFPATEVDSLSKALLLEWDAFSMAERCRGRVAGRHYFRTGSMAETSPAVRKGIEALDKCGALLLSFRLYLK